MDVFLIISFIFIISLIYYAINLYFPVKSSLKYYISLSFGIIGISGWIYIWLGNGWILAAVVSTTFILLSAISLVTAFIIDIIFRKKKQQK